jgi:hypothetical protein
MPRYSLRTLIVVMLLGGPALAGGWFAGSKLWEGDEWPYLGLCALVVTAVMTITVFEHARAPKD